MRQQIGRLESSWIRVGPLTIHAKSGVDQAPAKALPLVCVHGLLVSSRYMLAAAVRLTPYHPVYALDLPGYGKSSKPPATAPILKIERLSNVLRDWMDTMGLEQVGLVANSFGCQIATDFALRYPGRTRCLLLVGPTIDADRHSLLQQTSSLLLDATREPPRRYLRVLAADLWDIGLPRVGRLVRVALRDHIEERLPRIAIPTLIVRGGRDPLVPQRWAEQVAALLPNSRLETIQGYGHIVHFSAPDAFTAVARHFLDEVAQGP